MLPRYLTTLDPQAFFEAACQIPYQKVDSDLFPGIELWIRRDDLLDPIISGNKAYKLLFNLIRARERGVDTLITCGGAWSNHIHATAAAGARFGFNTVGIIRGERPPVLSATLQDAERFGMELVFICRSDYRRRQEPDFLRSVGIERPDSYFIPEGGANLAGAEGVRLWGRAIEVSAPVRFDQLWLACGTGLTLAGLSHAVRGCLPVGVEVLKAGESIRRSVEKWQSELLVEGGGDPFAHFVKDSHAGGYAKYPGYLAEFRCEFEQKIGISLDPIYTVKVMWALHKKCTSQWLEKSVKIAAVHSGGLQGWRGIQHAQASKK